MSIRTTLRRAGAAAAMASTVVATAVALSTPAHAATGFVKINNFNSGLALTADAASAGASVRQQPPSPAAANRQQWRVETFSGTAAVAYHLRANDNLCLDLPRDVDRSQQQAGEVIVVRPCDGSNSQKWLDVNTVSNGGNIQNRLSVMKIDVDNNKPTAAGAVALQNNVSQPSQKFFKTPV